MNLFRLSLACAVLLPLARAEDRDLSSFGSPTTPPALAKTLVAPQTKVATEPKVSSRADLLAPPTASVLPPRTFSAGNGYAKIQSRGRGLDFTFNDARFADAITEISRTFDCVISYAGDPERRVIGRFGNIRSAGQLLALMTDMTDLVVVVTQRGYIIQQLDSARIPTLKLEQVLDEPQS